MSAVKTSLAILALAGSASAFTPSLFSGSSRSTVRTTSLGLRMACPLIPLGSNVIIKMEKESGQEQMTSSGIMIAASVKSEGPKTGIIEAVGTGWHTESGTLIAIEDVKVGDKVMFREPTSFEARKMKTKEGEFYVLSVNDILAKMKE